MFEQVMPVLPLLIVCHAWMCVMVAKVLEDEDIHPLSPECFPA
jgi:hypothetical protein